MIARKNTNTDEKKYHYSSDYWLFTFQSYLMDKKFMLSIIGLSAVLGTLLIYFMNAAIRGGNNQPLIHLPVEFSYQMAHPPTRFSKLGASTTGPTTRVPDRNSKANTTVIVLDPSKDQAHPVDPDVISGVEKQDPKDALPNSKKMNKDSKDQKKNTKSGDKNNVNGKKNKTNKTSDNKNRNSPLGQADNRYRAVPPRSQYSSEENSPTPSNYSNVMTGYPPPHPALTDDNKEKEDKKTLAEWNREIESHLKDPSQLKVIAQEFFIAYREKEITNQQYYNLIELFINSKEPERIQFAVLLLQKEESVRSFQLLSWVSNHVPNAEVFEIKRHLFQKYSNPAQFNILNIILGDTHAISNERSREVLMMALQVLLETVKLAKSGATSSTLIKPRSFKMFVSRLNGFENSENPWPEDVVQMTNSIKSALKDLDPLLFS